MPAPHRPRETLHALPSPGTRSRSPEPIGHHQPQGFARGILRSYRFHHLKVTRVQGLRKVGSFWQEYLEARSSIRRTGDSNLAMMLLDNLTTNHQTEPGPLAACLCREEWFENLCN